MITTTNRKRIVRTLVIIAVIVAVLLSLHVLVNSFDLFGVLRSMHGG
jgi:hypothetical protein